jgi:SWI/SNF-related matrix-associated actin-dependent regulator 1 of chromatin subfamily A
MDEGHYAKNYDSKRTGVCLKLAEYAKHSIVVTATPLKNRVKELHPLLRMTRRLWTEESMNDFTKYYDTEEGREEIAERLSGFMVRRMFKEVKPDFPTGEVGEAWLELSNRDDYKEVEVNFIQWLIRQGADLDRLAAAERGRALVKLNKLRELSAHGKVDEAARLIGQTLDAGEQCIVFCSFNAPLFRIAETFAEKEGTNFKGQKFKGSAMIVGGVSKKKRYETIDKFMAGEIGLLCIGVGAGGLGIDLPIARFAYFLDLPWNPADFEQCTGRILRLGQERDCQFIKLLASRTIDQRMEEIIQIKATIFQEAIGDKDAVSRVTAKDPRMMQSSIVSMICESYLRDLIIEEAAEGAA